MNKETLNPSIEPELEARIVALVLGEASDFEREELNRLVEQRPELAAFKLRMQKTHGLLQDVGTGEYTAPENDWKLPADRRNAVLAVIRGEATVQHADDSMQPAGDVNPLIDHTETTEIKGLTSPARQIADDGRRLYVVKNKSTRRWQWNVTKVATILCVIVFFGIMALPSFFRPQFTPENRLRQVGFAVHNYSAPPSTVAANAHMSQMSSTLLFKDGSVAADGADLYARSGPVDIDYQTNSGSALSAIQNMLSFSSTDPSPDYLTDDVEYFPRGQVFELPEATITQDNDMALEKGNRARVTIVDNSSSIQTPTNDSALIAGNDGASNYKVLGENDGVAPGNLQSKSPSVGDGELSFPMAAPGGAGVNGPGPGVTQFWTDVPNGGKVLLGGIAAQSATQAAPSAGDSGAVSPAIIIGDEEEVALGVMSRITGETATLSLADVASPEGIPNESRRFETQDFRSLSSHLEKRLGQQSVPEGEEARRQFGKDSMAPDGWSRVDGEHFGNEAKWDSQFDIAGTTAPASGTENTGPGSLFDRGGRRLGRYADDTSAGYSGFGSGGEFGLNLPSDELNNEVPADAEGSAEGKMDGIASFDDSGLENSSRSKVPARNPMNETRHTNEWSDQRGLEALHEAIALPDPTAEQVALSQNGDDKTSRDEKGAGKKAASAVADNDTEWIKKDSKGIEMPDAGGVGFEDTFEAAFDFNIQDTLGNPAETPALGTRQLKLPVAKTGDGSQVQDNRESQSQSIQTPAPVIRAFVVPETAQPQQRYMLKGSDSVVEKYWEVLPSEKKEQLVESQRKSGDLSDLWNKSRYNMTPLAMTEFADSMKRRQVKGVAPPAGLNEKAAADEAFSTFSLHVSDVSFKLTLAALARGEWPEAAKIRIEEFVNAFDYGDPLPAKGEKVACRIEQSIHPFVQQRNLLRISMRTAAAGRATNTSLRLTFLLDNSGSMERTDRQQTVRRAFALLAQQLTPIDQVTLISFARQPRLLADKVSGADVGQLVRLIDELPSEGGTNIEAALQLAYEKAHEQQSSDGQNRIVLLTDGAVNLGDADPESLSQMVTSMRNTGIAFDAAGISADGLNDEVLEALTRKGDGRYYLLDSIESADDGFVRQIAGALRPSAKNVKVQIEFNPKRVGHYKLLGFEKHILNTEDFRNDAVDAAEMAAAEAGVALYQIEAKPDGEGDVGSVSVRFQDLSTGEMIENRWPIPYEADAPRPDQAAPSLRIATSAALLAAKLRGEPLGETVDLQVLSQLVSGLPEPERSDTRVQQLKQMIEQARQLSGK